MIPPELLTELNNVLITRKDDVSDLAVLKRHAQAELGIFCAALAGAKIGSEESLREKAYSVLNAFSNVVAIDASLSDLQDSLRTAINSQSPHVAAIKAMARKPVQMRLFY